jgi:DNA-directed RNA polymerase subunit RPC12/RpoP
MGRYITKRAWVSKCRYCGMPIFYWESILGHKVIFNYPIYDRLQKHICEKYYQEMQLKNLPKIPKYIRPEPERKNPLEVDEFKIYKCPVCSKSFKAESILNNHITTMKKIDEDHSLFFDSVLKMIDDEIINEEFIEESIKKNDNYRINQDIQMKTEFGRVVFRNKRK